MRTIINVPSRQNIVVSTVYLAVDHNLYGKKPIHWETMILIGGEWLHQRRFTSCKKAEDYHEEICDIITSVINFVESRN